MISLGVGEFLVIVRSGKNQWHLSFENKDATIRDVKDLLSSSPTISANPEQLILIRKGKKKAENDTVFQGCGGKKVKIMLRFTSDYKGPNKKKSEPVSTVPSKPLPGERQEETKDKKSEKPVELSISNGSSNSTVNVKGNESVRIEVRSGKRKWIIACDDLKTKILEVKEKLQMETNALPRQQILIYRGKRRDDNETLESLSSSSKMKMMLRFTEDFQLESAGAKNILTVSESLKSLEDIVAKTDAKFKHGYFDRALITLELSALDDKLRTLLGSVEESHVKVEMEKNDMMKRLDDLRKRIDGLKQFALNCVKRK